ncbi:hypothetical protein [Nocardioides sp.]|uniref:hypothetical protein n=1 Tax=Nocardioides sp. TaxID=35761 RepID=UPI002B8F476B|nr:hypothetical protein [Nocardioides sp.]HXH77160.1 hypothetical protein [Nocardioides sp.]
MVLTAGAMRQHLDLGTDTSQDARLAEYEAAAVELVNKRIGPVLPRAEVDMATWNGPSLVLRHSPVISVQSITSGGTPVSSSQFRLDGPAGILRANGSLHGPVEVNYTAGYAFVPELVRQVLLDLVRVRYESRAGALPVEVAEEQDLPRAFPPDDEAILARLTPYRRGPRVD